MTTAAAPLWRPTRARREQANVTCFMTWLAENRDLVFSHYADLWWRSVNELESFLGVGRGDRLAAARRAAH